MEQSPPVTKPYDDTPPRNDIIFWLTVASGVVLFALSFLFKSYFSMYAEAELQAKVLSRGSEALAAARAEDAKKLHEGKVPIDQAMLALQQEGRLNIPVIAPKASDETEALAGWSFHPRYEARRAMIEGKAGSAVAVADTEATEGSEASDEGAEADESGAETQGVEGGDAAAEEGADDDTAPSEGETEATAVAEVDEAAPDQAAEANE